MRTAEHVAGEPHPNCGMRAPIQWCTLPQKLTPTMTTTQSINALPPALTNKEKFLTCETMIQNPTNRDQLESASSFEEMLRDFHSSWFMWVVDKLTCGATGCYIKPVDLANTRGREEFRNNLEYHKFTVRKDMDMTLKDVEEGYVATSKELAAIEPEHNNHVMQLKKSVFVVNEVITAIVAKKGYISDNEANRLDIDRYARKIMRDNNFRDKVIDVHITAIVEEYFNARTHFDVSRKPKRISRWLLKWLGFNEGKVPDRD